MKYYWTTKEGKKVDVDEMSIEHLRNVLKLYLKYSYQKKNKVFELNGDIANMYNDDCEISDLQYEFESEDYGCRGI